MNAPDPPLHIPKEARDRIPVAILGATGTVGQRFVSLLERHPWFELVAVAASERSSGKSYREAARWIQGVAIPGEVADLEVVPCQPEALPTECRLVLSALDSSVAHDVELAFAEAGYLVVSNASSHRMRDDVPLLVPEVNADHLALARIQQRSTSKQGAILTNPNCSTIGLVMALKPLHEAFGIESLFVASMQAASGAGLPGVPSYELLDNVIPFISGEEEKIEAESRKILGHLVGDREVVPASFTVSAQCNRVPVVDGHTLCVSVGLERRAEPDELVKAWTGFRGQPQELGLPSAPDRPLVYLDSEAAPQPRLHRDLGAGMTTSIGRLRPCPLLDYRFVTLSHNTVRGAAGGALLVAELAVLQGYLPTAATPSAVETGVE